MLSKVLLLRSSSVRTSSLACRFAKEQIKPLKDSKPPTW